MGGTTQKRCVRFILTGIIALVACSVHIGAIGPNRVCTQPKVIGPCRAAVERYYFDTTRRTCLPFVYGGCRGNGNNFQTMEDCRKRCFLMLRRDTCKLPPRTGPCKAGVRKYHYNSIIDQCVPFIYGGCRGNANNFDSLEECTQTCGIRWYT